MNEKETQYAAKLINKLIHNSSTSLEPEDFENTLNEWEKQKTGVHIYIGAVENDDIAALEPMSMEDYRYYINKKIYDMPVHLTGRKTSYTVHITEEGLLRMKEEYDYETYVLESVRSVLEQPVNSMFSNHFLLYFTANQDENYGMSCGSIDGVREYQKKKQEEYFREGNQEGKQEKRNKQEVKRLEPRKQMEVEKEKRMKEYYDIREGNRYHSRSAPILSSKIDRMYYAYNIARGPK